MTIDIILAILEIFGIFALGWLACHLGYIREEELNRWSRFVVDFLMPCLAFSAIVSGFDASRLRELAILPFLGLGMVVFGSLAGILLRRGLKTKDPDIRKTFHHFCAINNYSFLPIVIVTNLWGSKALANLFFLNLGSSIGFWTVGVGLLGGSNLRQALRSVLTVNLLAVLLALGITIAGVGDAVPTLVMKITGTVGAAAVPCMLLLVGAAMHPLPAMTNRRDLTYLAFVRLIVLPVLIVLAIRMIPNIPEDVRNIVIIVSLMPAAISSTVLTRRFGGSPTFAVQAAAFTMALSIITVPLLLHFLM